MSNTKQLFLTLATLATGIFLGILISNHFNAPPHDQNVTEQHSFGQFSFINPLLECDLDHQSSEVTFQSLEQKIIDYIKEAKRTGLVSQISVYWRDLNNGPWIGIDEKNNFTPSSLLKVPIMIAILKQSEQDSKLLENKLLYKGNTETEVTPIYTPSKMLEKDQSYSIDELLNRMIIYSDNNAKNLLLDNIDSQKIDAVYGDLGILLPPETLADDYMSVKEYAALFRILYNGSYLSRENSEKALKILSQSDFKVGLLAGVPEGIKVAHKFGERELENGVNQLHDCGIIYYPNHPYLLCVMTRGDKLEVLPGVIAQISRIVYGEISTTVPKAP